MIKYEIKKKSRHDYLTGYWPINLSLISSFYAEKDWYCRLYEFVILSIDPHLV